MRGFFQASGFSAGLLPVPSGQWPDGTGRLPVLPVPASGFKGTCAATRFSRAAAHRTARYAFSLVEILVAVGLMSLIVVALMAVFSSTQTAFRASLTQTDVLESSRAAMGMVVEDLGRMTPTFLNKSNNFVLNCYIATSPNAPMVQGLPGSGQFRTNVVEEVFLLSRQNQTWTGVGYFVHTNTDGGSPIGWPAGDSGSLYRYEESRTAAQFANNPQQMFNNFQNLVGGTILSNNASRILDGVVGFKIRAFDPDGYWITNHVSSNFLAYANVPLDEYAYLCYSNALPSAVELELAILEDRALQRAESIQNGTTRSNYLSQQAGKVHVFRQRILIRNADQ